MSNPQTVATQVVFNYEYDTAGKALSGLNVHCVLNYGQATISSPAVSIEANQQSTTTDANGYWQFSLVPNVNISPANTTYTIIVQGGPTYDVTVGAAGPYQATAVGTIVNTPQALSPATSGLTGPITVTGNETVTGNLTVNGTSTLAGTTTGALTTGAASVGGDLTIQSAFRLLIATAASKLVPGATSFSVRDNADANDNLLVTNAGAATVRNGLTVTAGDAVITAGRLLLSAAAAKIKGGATSLSLRNNADTADNVLVSDAGAVTLRNALSMPAAAGGSLPSTSYGTVPILYDVQTPTGATMTIPSSGSLPTSFRVIRICWRARTTSANLADQLNMTFNGDTGANYAYQAMSATGATITGAAVSPANFQRIGFAAGGTAGANNFNSGWVEIVLYADSTAKHAHTSMCYRNDSQLGFDSGSGVWTTVTGITSITIVPAAGNYASGTTFETELRP